MKAPTGPEHERERQREGDFRLVDAEIGGDVRQGDDHQEEVEGVQRPAQEAGHDGEHRLASRNGPSSLLSHCVMQGSSSPTRHARR